MPLQVIIVVVVFIILLIILSIYYVDKSITCNDTNTCSNLVTLGNWKLNSETANDAILVRECNKIGFIDGCKQLSKEAINAIVHWTDISCNKACGSGVGNKSVIYNNTTIHSVNTYPCTREDCNALVTLGNWTLSNQDISSATLTRTCTNKYINRDACSLLAETFTKKIIPWTNTGACNKPCDTGTLTKTVRFNNTGYTSNPINCNTEACSSMVNFGDWTLSNQDISSATFTRTCTNNNINTDTCSLLPETYKSQTVAWDTSTSCTRLCDTGTLTKSVRFNNTDYTSNPINCNTETCSSMVNFGNWTFVNRNSINPNSANVTRTCFNINPNRNACSLIPNSEKNQIFPLTSTGTCSKLCDSGIVLNVFSLNGQNVSVIEDCNIQPCPLTITLTNFGTVDLSSTLIPQYGSLNELFTVGIFRTPKDFYDTTDGTYTTKNNIITIDAQGISHAGVWIQIKFSSSTIIKRYTLNKTDIDYPIDWVLLASNNGTSWTLLDTRTNIPKINKEFSITNNTGYIFYRLVFKRTNNSVSRSIPVQNQGTLYLYDLVFFTT